MAEQQKPVLDHKPGAAAASGGLLGEWSITYPDGTGLMAGKQAVLEDAAKRGFRSKDLEWTKAARTEFFRELRRRYGRGRGRR